MFGRQKFGWVPREDRFVLRRSPIHLMSFTLRKSVRDPGKRVLLR